MIGVISDQKVRQQPGNKNLHVVDSKRQQILLKNDGNKTATTATNMVYLVDFKRQQFAAVLATALLATNPTPFRVWFVPGPVLPKKEEQLPQMTQTTNGPTNTTKTSTGRPIFATEGERIREAYLRMAREVRYRPAAPGDGLGSVELSAEEMNDSKLRGCCAAVSLMRLRSGSCEWPSAKSGRPRLHEDLEQAQDTDTYQPGNRETAQIVLADVPRFGGESLMVRWARLVLDPPAERSRPEIGRPA